MGVPCYNISSSLKLRKPVTYITTEKHAMFHILNMSKIKA